MGLFGYNRLCIHLLNGGLVSAVYWFRIGHLLPKRLVYYCACHVAAVATLHTKDEDVTADEALSIFQLEHKIEV